MKAVSPVVPGHSLPETTFGKDSKYVELPTVVVPGPEGEVITRWELSVEEQALLANGGHVYLSILTFGDALQPVKLLVATPDMIMDQKRQVEITPPAPDITVDEDVPPS